MQNFNDRVIIRHITNAVPSGNLAVITGDGFENAKVFMRRLSAGIDEVKAFLSAGKAISEMTFASGEESEAEIVKNADGHILTVKTPDGEFSGWQVTVKSGGEVSAPYNMNVPEIQWLQNDMVRAGEELRIFGQCFATPDCFDLSGEEVHGYGKMLTAGHGVSAFLRDSQGELHELSVTAASCYEVQALVPAGVPCGACTVYILNEKSGVPVALETEVFPCGYLDAVKDDSKIFNVRDYGAVGFVANSSDYVYDKTYENIPDSAPGFQRALDAAAAAGGGTVLIPVGRYHFYGSISIPRGVKLKGEDPNRVWLELPLGMNPRDGWGTYRQGSDIPVFIKGDGDFAIEDINIMSVYSAVVIGAPIRDGAPKLGDDAYNRVPCYANLIDDDRDADNVVIKNCHIYQSPTYIVHRKADRTEPFYVGEYENSKKYAQPISNYPSITCVWVAIAIKGRNIKVLDNVIEGGGNCLAILGGQNVVISGNDMTGGDMAGGIDFFSTCYNPDSTWRRQCRNIILENNVFGSASKTSRGVFWIMEEHANYYMANNRIKPFLWHCDSEGFCFHIWSNHMEVPIKKCEGDRLTIDMDQLYTNYGQDCLRGLFENHEVVAGAFDRGCIYVTGGRGIGTRIPVKESGGDGVTLEKPLDCELDETSVVCLSDFKKFENTFVVENKVGALGRGIYHWGGTYSNIVDGNDLCDNGGVVMEDLSGCGPTWNSAGEIFAQILNNRVTRGRGFYSNSAAIGLLGGETHDSTLSVVIRGNTSEDDCTLTALPRRKHEDGSFSYRGVVFENNVSRNCAYGIELGDGVSAVLRNNTFENVDQPIVDAGADFTVLD